MSSCPPVFSHKGEGVARKLSRSIQIEWGEMLDNWEWGKGPLHVRMMSMDLFCSAQRAPEPQLPLAWLGPPRSTATTVASERLQASISASVKRVGWTQCFSKGLPAWRWDG